jgi:hypothetical protein
MGGCLPIGFDQRTRELVVNEQDILLISVRSGRSSRDGEVVGTNDPVVYQFQ